MTDEPRLPLAVRRTVSRAANVVALRMNIARAAGRDDRLLDAELLDEDGCPVIPLELFVVDLIRTAETIWLAEHPTATNPMPELPDSEVVRSVELVEDRTGMRVA